MAWHFGCDTNTVSGPSCGYQFYIGKLGHGVTKEVSWALPSVGSPPYAFAYWNISGPGKRGTNTSAAWGSLQASKFWEVFNGSTRTGKVGKTLFGTVDTNGYSGTTVAHNRVTVGAFLTKLKSLAGSTYTYGLYGNTTELSDRLGGAGWTAVPVPVVVWEAHFLSEPYPSCSSIESMWASKATVNIGSYVPMIWQYASGSGYDYDVTKYDGGPDSGKWTATK